MSLSVSAVSPTHRARSISRMSSSESSLGSSADSATPRHQRSKKRTIQLVFPYAPATVVEVCVSNRCHFDNDNRNISSHQPYITTSEAEPLKSMPLCLIPNDTMRQLPPILHFGWSIDQDKFLEWCVSEGFQRTTTDINGHYVFDHAGTVAGALHYFAQRSGAGMFQPYFQLTCHRREPVIIALTSNYTVSDQLDGTRSEIFALGSLLQKEGLLNRSSAAARWYIDFKEWQWVVLNSK